MIPGTKIATDSLARVLATLFILFMLAIITIANRGDGDNWWAFIHDIPYGDKLGHIVLMAILGLLCNLAFHPRPIPALPSFISTVTFILFALITLEEISQAFLPTRTCDLLDWLADLTGLTLGQLAAHHIKPRP